MNGISIRDALKCNGHGGGNASVLLDVFGHGTYAAPTATSSLAITPMFPGSIIQNDNLTTGNSQAVTLQLRRQLELMEGERFWLNIRPITPPSTALSVSFGEFIRRCNTALLLCRQVFGRPGTDIGIGRVLWRPTVDVDIESRIAGLGSFVDLFEDVVDGSPGPNRFDGLQAAINVFFVNSLGASGRMRGLAGTGHCPPSPSEGAEEGTAGAIAGGAVAGCVVGSLIAGGAGCFVGLIVGAIIAGVSTNEALLAFNPQACAVNCGTPLQDGDFQRGKTMAHELGHYFGLSIFDLKDDLQTTTVGEVMLQGRPLVTTVVPAPPGGGAPVQRLDAFFTAEDVEEILESNCIHVEC